MNNRVPFSRYLSDSSLGLHSYGNLLVAGMRALGLRG